MKLCRAFGEQGKNRETFAKPCLGATPSWLSLATAKLHVTIRTSSLLSPLVRYVFSDNLSGGGQLVIVHCVYKKQPFRWRRSEPPDKLGTNTIVTLLQDVSHLIE